jgi:MFS family permease
MNRSTRTDEVRAPRPPLRLTPVQWIICAAAAIGFAFDIYEIMGLPLIVRPALLELSGLQPGTAAFEAWVGRLFYVPAIAGGLFGLLGGYLTDLFGRRRVLVASIVLYGAAALAAGFATSLPMLLALRCVTFAGVCVEFVAAVAWLAELFADRDQRERVLSYTQVFSAFGGLMVTGAYYLAVTYGRVLPAIYGGHQPWRYTEISGGLPALALILLAPWLPESTIWRERKAAGTLERPSFAELFRREHRTTTIVTTLMFACSYGAAFGSFQHAPRIVPGLPTLRTASTVIQQQAVSAVQGFQEVGGILGRLLLALLTVRIVGRRRLIRLFQIPGLVVVPLVFVFPATSNLGLLEWGIFLIGLCTMAQFSFWGNYLPYAYPTHLRATGESFAANIGGRMIGTMAALLTTSLAPVMPGATGPTRLAYAAAAVGTLTYAAGLVASFWLPEPGTRLPE